MIQSRRCVLDTTAILEWTLNKPKHDTIEQLLPYAVVPVSCLTESIYKTRHRNNYDIAEQLRVAGVEFEHFGVSDALRAGQLISDSLSSGDGNSLSMADGICIAIAERLRLALVSNDHYWETLDINVEVHPYY